MLATLWWCSAYANGIPFTQQRLKDAYRVYPNAFAHMASVAMAVPFHQAIPSVNLLHLLSSSPYGAEKPLLMYTRRAPRFRRVPVRKPTDMIVRIKRHRVVRTR
ncbi:hypothetical protein EVAR_97334_1 [Eumeta japonica]|uniref:Uncharacterized protein n=1 Tax=Eumeta variegata TaxID=151549 RepID=A0A4C1X7D9_EUMVA|nr:hypothetical protein EVAR_97334_1 [Eumeta japonica]